MSGLPAASASLSSPEDRVSRLDDLIAQLHRHSASNQVGHAAKMVGPALHDRIVEARSTDHLASNSYCDRPTFPLHSRHTRRSEPHGMHPPSTVQPW